MEFQDYRKESRETNWVTKSNNPLTIEEINCGSLLRLADALELMTKRYVELVENRDYWEESAKESDRQLAIAVRRVSGLRGYIKRLKKHGLVQDKGGTE